MMTPLLDDAQHFVRDPDWTWYILGYFLFAGLSGGSYFLASFLRLFGKDVDEPAARLSYYVAFLALLPCPVLLTLDLGQPLRFYHMLFEFKWWSPMSVGAWALTLFGALATVSFVEVLARDGKLGFMRWVARLLDGFLGKLLALVGALFGLFIAGYTGVLLSVSNQPVWSDTWALGGLFLASGLSGSAALVGWLLRFRRDAEPTAMVIGHSERLFQILELALIGVFAFTLFQVGAFERAFGYPWVLLWVVVAVGLIGGLSFRSARPARSPEGTGHEATFATTKVHTATLTMTLVLLGIIALRAAVIFSAQ
jgi:formate-dependent nitrite reductase membrane component NrfD